MAIFSVIVRCLKILFLLEIFVQNAKFEVAKPILRKFTDKVKTVSTPNFFGGTFSVYVGKLQLPTPTPLSSCHLHSLLKFWIRNRWGPYASSIHNPLCLCLCLNYRRIRVPEQTHFAPRSSVSWHAVVNN